MPRAGTVLAVQTQNTRATSWCAMRRGCSPECGDVQLVRRDGRDVSTLYGKGGVGGLLAERDGADVQLLDVIDRADREALRRTSWSLSQQ